MVQSQSIASNYASSLVMRESLDRRVIVADGSSVKVHLSYGQLVIDDGLQQCPRTRRISRVGSCIERIIVLGSKGYISLEAFRWCADTGIQIMQVTREGSLLFNGYTVNSADPSLIRAQLLGTEDKYISTVVTQHVLAIKLAGQARLLADFLGQSEASDRLQMLIADLIAADNIDECRRIEAIAANIYFNAWRNRVAIRWSSKDAKRLPAHWGAFRYRHSELSPGKANASDPINALLNYAYMVGYSEARIACIQAGLDPRLGSLHYDREGRDSLALDILETIRPDIDHCLLKMMNTRKWSRLDFLETRSGVCKLVAPVTHEICERSITWRDALNQAANSIVGILTGEIKPVIARRAPKLLPDYDLISSLVSDDAWLAISAELPESPIHVGRRLSDNRAVIAGILYKLQNDVIWARIPKSFGVGYSVMRLRYVEWSESGLWERIVKRIKEHSKS